MRRRTRIGGGACPGTPSGTGTEVIAAHDLDDAVARTDVVEATVRYVVLHLIQETARHAGHADIIRESLDGTTGI